jgi:hypothetical protein
VVAKVFSSAQETGTTFSIDFIWRDLPLNRQLPAGNQIRLTTRDAAQDEADRQMREDYHHQCSDGCTEWDTCSA